jgi:sterol desaturase/sphingolipid hydroxylase (fatty acid hydroxylase superfamily)
MNSTTLAWLAENYQWKLSFYAGLGIIAAVYLFKAVAWAVPTMRAAARLNAETFRGKMEKPHYAANQAWNRKWSLLFLVLIFAGILPFCLTAEMQPWWKVLLDTFVILMVYDFFYYLTHRFLFHDSDFFGGPLMWMHAVHHRQHNPCRWDSSYIHPLEIAIGLGLYLACIAGLSFVMGKFSVPTIVVTWMAFNQINLHNHNLWTEKGFPWRYISYLSEMHHNHHARFTGGNFATISLLYDWMFGTLDKGQGYPALDRLNARRAARKG